MHWIHPNLFTSSHSAMQIKWNFIILWKLGQFSMYTQVTSRKCNKMLMYTPITMGYFIFGKWLRVSASQCPCFTPNMSVMANDGQIRDIPPFSIITDYGETFLYYLKLYSSNLSIAWSIACHANFYARQGFQRNWIRPRLAPDPESIKADNHICDVSMEG